MLHLSLPQHLHWASCRVHNLHPKAELCCMAKCLEMLIAWVLCWFPELPRSTAHLYLLSLLGFISLFTDPPWDVPACGTFLPNRVDVGDFPVLVHHSVNAFIGFSTMWSRRFLKCMKIASPFSEESSHFWNWLKIMWQIWKPYSQSRFASRRDRFCWLSWGTTYSLTAFYVCLHGIPLGIHKWNCVTNWSAAILLANMLCTFQLSTMGSAISVARDVPRTHRIPSYEQVCLAKSHKGTAVWVTFFK